MLFLVAFIEERLMIFEKITKITQVVSALCNMKLDKHPIRK